MSSYTTGGPFRSCKTPKRRFPQVLKLTVVSASGYMSPNILALHALPAIGPSCNFAANGDGKDLPTVDCQLKALETSRISCGWISHWRPACRIGSDRSKPHSCAACRKCGGFSALLQRARPKEDRATSVGCSVADRLTLGSLETPSSSCGESINPLSVQYDIWVTSSRSALDVLYRFHHQKRCPHFMTKCSTA